MEKYLAAVVLIFLKYAFSSVIGLPWSFFDPLIALVVIYTFFHSLDIRDFVLYALFCGFLRDMLGLHRFGIFMLSYMACAFAVAGVTRIVYRQNWIFVFPMVFVGVFLSNLFVFFFEPFLSGSGTVSFFGWFLVRSLVESLGTVLVAYPLYLFSNRCASELTG